MPLNTAGMEHSALKSAFVSENAATVNMQGSK